MTGPPPHGGGPRLPAGAERAGAAGVTAACVGAPRPLTPDDLRHVAHFIRRDTGALAFAVPMAVGAPVFAWFTWGAARHGDWFAAAMVGLATACCAAAAWACGAMALRPHPLGRREDFARAQRVRGRLVRSGVPPRASIGGVPIAALPLDHVPEGAVVEADVSPAFADDPRPDRRRVLVGVPHVVAWPGARANERLATSA